MSDSEDSSKSANVRIRQVDSSPTTRFSSYDEVSRGEVAGVEHEVRFVQQDEVESRAGGDNDSEAMSQIGSDVSGYAAESPHNYIDLTRNDRCMVAMSRILEGVTVPCVCGNLRADCSRPGHQAKQGIANKLGLSRYYVKLPGKKGTCDGRMDRAPLTQDEGDRLLLENREEMERAAQALSGLETGDTDVDSDDVESVTPGVPRRDRNSVTTSRVTRSTTLNAMRAGSNSPTEASQPTFRELINARMAARTDQVDKNEGVTFPETHTPRGNYTVPVVPASRSLREQLGSQTHDPPVTLWIGLEHPVTRMRIYYADEPAVIEAALRRGYAVKKNFVTIEGAEQWLDQGLHPGAYGRTARTPHAYQPPPPPPARKPEVFVVADDDDGDDSSVEVHLSSQKPAPAPKKNREKNWFGLERGRSATRERAITNRFRIVRQLESERYKLKEVFTTKREAEYWLNELIRSDSGAEVDEESEGSEELSMSAGNGGQKTKKVDIKDASRHETQSDQASRVVIPKKTISLATAEFFTAETAGPDPSCGNKEQIYNLAHDDIELMDAVMCPPHMTQLERENFLEAVVDVTALPGMFRVNDGGDLAMDTDTATSIVATALGKKVSMTDVMWRSPTKNALSKIKTQAQLYELINGIEKAGKIAFQQQDGRMKAIMYRCNYDRTSIQLYLQAGLLPRMMWASYERYLALLYKARPKAIDHQGGWENSLGYEMIVHHARETMQIRHFSVDWRNFVIQTYIYLRDSEKKSFVDNTMYEGLFKRMSAPSDDAQSKSRERNPAPDVHTCSHCKCPIGDAHPGGKASCVFAALDYKKAKEAGRLFLLALKDSPRLDKAKKAKEILEEMGVGK